MKTNNYQFDLMYLGQDQKDITYNDAILKIDSLFDLNVLNFKETAPKDLSYGEKYLITTGQNKDKICYFAHESKGIQYIIPQNGMIIYLISENSYMKFNNQWEKLTSIKDEKFIGISDNFTVTNDCNAYCLYLLNNTELIFATNVTFLLTIKQNHQSIYDIKWPQNILWPNKQTIKVSNKINAIDCFRFHKLPESEHFLAEIINQNYQY